MLSLLPFAGLPSLVVLVVTTLVVYNVALVVYRLCFHPLAKFPGRKLAAASRWYEFYFDCIKGDGGQYFKELDHMHEKYGPVIRVTPDEIYVRDPNWYDVLYEVGPVRDKYGPSARMAGTPMSAFGTEPHALHKIRRAPLNPFFSKRSVAALQPKIQEIIEDLCNGMRDSMVKGNVVELRVAFLSLTIDVICTYAFGSSLGACKEPKFAPRWNDAVTGTARSAPVTKQISGIVAYLQKLPLSMIKAMHPDLGQLLTLRKRIREQVVAIKAQYQNGSISEKNPIAESQRTIFHTLIESDLPPQEKEEERLTDEAFALVGAGTETTKQTLNCMVYFLLMNPHMLARLKKELWDVMPTPYSCPPLHVFESLPYFSSVVKETLRITTSVTSRLPLVAPTQVLRHGNWEIPAGTPVSMDLRSTMIDARIFPEPMLFEPERWIQSAQRGEHLERFLMPFSRGTRGCLGQNLAMAEVYLTIATLFRRFEFELFQTDRSAVAVTNDYFAAGLSRQSKGTRVRVVCEYDE